MPVKGVEVSISPANITLQTNDLGKYKSSVPSGTYTLFFYKEGFTLIEKVIKVTNKNEVLNLSLVPSNVSLDEVMVFATPTKPTKRIDDALHTGTEITLKGLETSGVATNNSIFKLLNIVPSVTTFSTDAYGLGDNKMRVRGVQSQYTGMTVEGVPNYALSPIGAREHIYDKENLQSVSLYKGAVPADVFSGSGNRGGSVDLSFRRSPEDSGAEFVQSLGTDNYNRTFFRYNTGEFENGNSKSSAFVSLSSTSADKWKGHGKLAKRKNLSVGFTHKFDDKLKLEFFTVYNNTFKHKFMRFKYKDIQNFDKNYYKDFTDLKYRELSEFKSYYDYNNGDKTNISAMVLLQYSPTENSTLSFKPYYGREEGEDNISVYSKKTKKTRLKTATKDFWQAGAVLSYQGKYNDFNYAVGYWLEASKNASDYYFSSITREGYDKTRRKRDIFVDAYGLDYFHTPYAKVSYTKGRFKAQAGLKYMGFKSRGSTRYYPAKFPTGGGTDYVRAATPSEEIATKPRLNDAWLPSLGLGYKFTDNLEAYINYGKGYMRQYGGITGDFLKNRAKFRPIGYKLQTLLDEWKTETSDNFDIGIIFNSKSVRLNVNGFYAKQNNVMAKVLNSKVNVVYNQNVGTATGYGAELESYFRLTRGLTFFANPSYTRYSYDNDLVKSATKSIKIKGNQSPAVPQFMIKTGLMYNYKQYSANLFASHTGERFGDATNKEKVNGFTLFDVSFGYNFDLGDNISLDFSAEVKNLTNKKYVGLISSGDYTTNNKSVYYYGAPSAFLGSVRFNF